ncbi:MAG TPA: AMP-binding protein, partial [Streptosporangiaceae bacterium]|nr:AMP-binding protein [Streptosporangiaceae bacterium]
ILGDSGSRAMVTESLYAAVAAQAVEEAGSTLALRVSVDRGACGFDALDELPTAMGSDSAGSVLLYTSGTSGCPKGVVSTLLKPGAPLEAVAVGAAKLGSALGIPEQGRAMLVGPWYHSGQLFFSLYPLLRGCSLVMRRKFDPEETLDLIDTHEVTIAHLVPTQFIRMLRVAPQRRAAFRGDSLSRVWHGGSACPPEVKQAMIDWWGPVLVEYYAATESGIVTLIDSPAWLKKKGSVGRPATPGQVAIVGEDGCELGHGQEGRIAIRLAPGRRLEYANAPDKTAAAYVVPDAFTVGDVGYLDEDGYLFLTARSAEVIVSGGMNIYPAEVEGVLLAHWAVRDAVVIGVPDEEFGEQVKALVEAEPGASGHDLPAVLDVHCRAQLAGFKVPRSYEVVAQLPREPTGKIARQPLREPYWAGAGRRI